MPNHTGRLMLTTRDPHASPPGDLLVETLTDSGFIGLPLPGREDAYCVGPQFLSLVSFTGCAVAIEHLPRAATPFCHVVIPPLSPVPRLHQGRNTRAPRCRTCRERLRDWKERMAYWADHPRTGIDCANCGEIRPPWLWDWKHQGGVGRLFVQIEEIFPGEATPTETLLDLLTRSSGTGWNYFYIQD